MEDFKSAWSGRKENTGWWNGVFQYNLGAEAKLVGESVIHIPTENG